MQLRALVALSASAAVIAFASGGVAQSQSRTRSISQSTTAKAAQQHPQILEEFGGEESAARSAYVRSVGARVAAQSNITNGANAFHITTLNSPVMNAFAVPGGYLYVTRQLVGLANDEAELASVLGHEAGHIAAQHSKQRQRAGLLSQILAVGAALVTGSNQVGQLAGQVSQGLFLSYSRKQELEADDLGVRYITAAGYDPMASATFLTSLGAATALETRAAGNNDERSTPSWARTHPLSSERVSRATKQAQATRRTGGLRNRDQFLAQIEGIMVDDDPKQGVIDGRTFTHPDLKLRFQVPDGYGMQNGTRAVSIVGQQGQAQFGTAAFNGNLGTYIAAAFQSVVGQQAGQVNYSQPRSTTVNGIPAAYSTARVNTQQGQVDLTIFAYQWNTNSAYHFAMITPAGRGLGPFSSMVQSVTRLSTAEAAAIRPRVIDVVTVGPSDTVQSLANRMAYNDLKLDRFRVLNGLASNATVRPGQKVKLIVFGSR